MNFVNRFENGHTDDRNLDNRLKAFIITIYVAHKNRKMKLPI